MAFTPSGGNSHYGWIAVERDGLNLEAVAWGYETDEKTPIAAGSPQSKVPVPTVSEFGMMGLALGLLAVGCYNRRRLFPGTFEQKAGTPS